MRLATTAAIVAALALAGCEAPTAQECRAAHARSMMATPLWRACIPVMAEDRRATDEARRADEANARAARASEEAAAVEKLRAAESRRAARKINPDQPLLSSLETQIADTSRKLKAMRLATTCGVRSNGWFGQLSFVMQAQSQSFYNNLKSRVVDPELFAIDERDIRKKYEGADRPPFPSRDDCESWFRGDNGLYELDTMLARAMGRGY